jgi:Cu/Zn superoxide dismutase
MRRDRASVSARTTRTLAAVTLAAAALAGCSWLRSSPEPQKPAAEDASRPRYGLFSRLKALDSAVWGRARVVDRADGITLTLSVTNLPMGPFRVAFGETANCGSPNGFSAGQPWAPATAGKDPHDLIPPLFNRFEGSAETSVFVPGVHASGPDGVDKRSIILYTGSAVTDARPDVPNTRIACGTFEPAQPFEI